MKKIILSLICGIVFAAIPSLASAEEVEIQLFEVISMGFIPGDNPLDDSNQSPKEPTRPTSFRATINGNTLAIQKLESTIPSAQATVVNASTGSIVVNQQFTTSYQGQISNAGVYVLHIQTEGGALVGQFVVQ
jgi:hypothetical protein